MITIIFDVEQLFNLVNQRTLNWASRLNGTTEQSDLIPLTNNDEDFFQVHLKEVANEVWLKLARWFNEEIDDPFQVNFGPGDSTYSNSVVFQIDPPEHYKESLHNNPLTVCIQKAMVYYVTSNWLLQKGFNDAFQADMILYDKEINRIASVLMFKQRTSTTYRTL